MKEFLIGSLLGTMAGLVVGGIMVARNKKLSNKINQGIDNAEQKVKDAKDAIEKKLKECKIGEENNSMKQKCESDPSSKVCC